VCYSLDRLDNPIPCDTADRGSQHNPTLTFDYQIMDAEMHVEEFEHDTSQDSTSRSPARKKMRGDVEPAQQFAQSGIEISKNGNMQLQLDPFILWLDQLPVGQETVLKSKTIQYIALCREGFEKFERSIQTRPTGTEITLDEIFDAEVFLRYLVILLDAEDMVRAVPDFTSPPFWLSEFMRRKSASGSREATEKLVEAILEASTLVLSSVSDIMNDLLATYQDPTERSDNITYRKTLIDSFHRPYVGAGARNLRKHIMWVAEEFAKGVDFTDIYSRAIPIIQSSGFGKTRAVLELGKEELGLFVCARNATPSTIDTSLPAQDELVMKWLAPKGNEEREIAARRMTCWLSAVASTMTSLVRKKRADMFPHLADKSLTDAEWKSLVQHIARLLDPIGENGTVSFDHTRRTTGSERMRLLEEIDRLATKRFEEFKSESFAAVTLHAVEAFETLETILPPSGDSFFHIAIDECSQIGNHVLLLRTMWADIATNRTRYWLLFLDTNASILRLSTKTDYGGLRLGPLKMLRPFAGLPLDVEIDQDNSTRKDFTAIVRAKSKLLMRNYWPISERWAAHYSMIRPYSVVVKIQVKFLPMPRRSISFR
jgi:hypothetical protein